MREWENEGGVGGGGGGEKATLYGHCKGSCLVQHRPCPLRFLVPTSRSRQRRVFAARL